MAFSCKLQTKEDLVVLDFTGVNVVSNSFADECIAKLLSVSIIETSEHAAKRYLSTLAVLQLDSILMGARKVSSSKPKPGNKNQKPFERILNMEYELIGIGTVKMTVGVRRSTHKKVQYCITAIDNKE